MPWQRPDTRSRLCIHRITWPRKPIIRIKQRVASCHTTELIAHRKPKKWLPWQRPLVARCRQYLHSVGRPLKPPSITNRLVAIVHTKPVIALLVPKLVAMATQRPLDPRSRVCLHWIAWPRKPTPRIKQWVASCYTAEVMSIQSLPAPPPTPRGQPISVMGGGPPTDWHYCFRFPDFPRSMECRSSKVAILVRTSPKSGVFRP